MNLKLAGRAVAFGLLGLLGVGRLLHAINRRAGRVPVIVFHRVSPHPDPFWPPYTPDDFRRLIAFLARRYRFIPLDDLLTKDPDELRDGIVITFDDAWYDFVEHALPVLRDHKVPVVQFVATAPVQERSLIWTSLLDQAFRRTEAASVEVTLEDGPLRFALPDEATRVRVADRVQRMLKDLPDSLRRQALDTILAQLGRPAADPRMRLCTWEELRALRAEVPLHAHSASHPCLPRVEEDEQLGSELVDCQRSMTAELGDRPRHLAYPMGAHDDRVVALTARHYEAAFATGNALVELERLRHEPGYRYRMPRFNLTDTRPHEAYLRLNGFHGWLLRVMGRSA
jgi:peptidoglycan/xylan/chitin deacetylase (PgdA/CDA1 family)